MRLKVESNLEVLLASFSGILMEMIKGCRYTSGRKKITSLSMCLKEELCLIHGL